MVSSPSRKRISAEQKAGNQGCPAPRSGVALDCRLGSAIEIPATRNEYIPRAYWLFWSANFCANTSPNRLISMLSISPHVFVARSSEHKPKYFHALFQTLFQKNGDTFAIKSLVTRWRLFLIFYLNFYFLFVLKKVSGKPTIPTTTLLVDRKTYHPTHHQRTINPSSIHHIFINA